MAAAPPRREALLCRAAGVLRRQLGVCRSQGSLAVCADLPFRADPRRADRRAGRAPAPRPCRAGRRRGGAAAACDRRARAPADGFVRQQLLYQPEDLCQKDAGHGFCPAGRAENARRSRPDPAERKLQRIRSWQYDVCGNAAAAVRVRHFRRRGADRDALHAARAGDGRRLGDPRSSALSARLCAASRGAHILRAALREPRIAPLVKARAAGAARQPVFQLLCGNGDRRARPRRRRPDV